MERQIDPIAVNDLAKLLPKDPLLFDAVDRIFTELHHYLPEHRDQICEAALAQMCSHSGDIEEEKCHYLKEFIDICMQDHVPAMYLKGISDRTKYHYGSV